MRNRKAFTLVEIMIVVAIIAILAAITIPELLSSRKMSRLNKCLSELKLAERANEQAALNLSLTSGATIAQESLNPWVYRDGASNMPECPSGGSLDYYTVAQDATCDVHGSISNPTPLSALSN